MAFIIDRSTLKQRMNAGIHGKIGMLIDADAVVNDCVSEVLADVDMRSTKRKVAMQPNLFSEVFAYAAPTDLKKQAVCGLRSQIEVGGQSESHKWFLVPAEEFHQKKQVGMVALDDFNGIRQLKVVAEINDQSMDISTLDSLTAGGGIWQTVGDAESLSADSDNFVAGVSSLKFNIGSGATTTAGIKNTALNAFDLDDQYLGGNGAVFIFAYINSTTNLTNYILEIGSSSSNYYKKTVTAQHDGTAFVAGWNLLRFDLTSLTTVGTPNNNAITYLSCYMTKTAGKISETDYRFDHIVIRKGQIFNVIYYSKYGWQNLAGTYLEQSTSDTDLLVADSVDEVDLIQDKCVARAAKECNEYDIAADANTSYKENVKKYRKDNPSEALIMSSEYYAF